MTGEIENNKLSYKSGSLTFTYNTDYVDALWSETYYAEKGRLVICNINIKFKECTIPNVSELVYGLPNPLLRTACFLICKDKIMACILTRAGTLINNNGVMNMSGDSMILNLTYIKQ